MHPPEDALGELPSLLLPVPRFVGCGCITTTSASDSSWHSPLCVSVSCLFPLSYKDTNQTWSRGFIECVVASCLKSNIHTLIRNILLLKMLSLVGKNDDNRLAGCRAVTNLQ